MVNNLENFIFQQSDGTWVVILENQFYEKQVVMEAAYKFSSLCLVNVVPHEERKICVFFGSRDCKEIDLEKITQEFYRELLDYQIRQDLNRKFGHLRDLIVEHAFAPLTNLKERLDGR